MNDSNVVDLFQNRTPPSPLQPGGGDGTYDGMEARAAALETHVEHIRDDVRDIKRDIRWILGALGGGFLFLVVAYGAGYMRLSDKIDGVNRDLSAKLDTLIVQTAPLKSAQQSGGWGRDPVVAPPVQ